MATGLQTSNSPKTRLFRLIDGAAADVVAPTTAASGVEVPSHLQFMQTERVAIAISDRSGTGTLAFTYIRLWGYLIDLNKWFPLGTGTDADRGKINEGAAIGEVAADDLRLIEMAADVSIFDRLALELNGLTGTNPVMDGDLVVPRHIARYR